MSADLSRNLLDLLMDRVLVFLHQSVLDLGWNCPMRIQIFIIGINLRQLLTWSEAILLYRILVGETFCSGQLIHCAES